MKKIIFFFSTVSLIASLCSYTYAYPEPIPIENGDKNSATIEVANLVKELAMADSKQSEIILAKINSIRKKNPDNTNILLMYTNSLIGEKHYKEGINFLKTLYAKKPTRTYLLTQCMLNERLGHKEASCYEEVVKTSEKKNLLDSDYVTALFFTDTKKFDTVKKQLIKNEEFKESDFLIYTLGREKMLLELFP